MMLRLIVVSLIASLVVAVPVAGATPQSADPRNSDADGRVLRDRPDGAVVSTSARPSDAFERYLRNHVEWQSPDAIMRFLRNHPNGYGTAREHPDGFASAAAGVARGDLAVASDGGADAGIAWLELSLGLGVGMALGLLAAGATAVGRSGRLAHS